MNEMTLPSRHRIRNSSPGGLRPSTLPLGHGVSPQYWIFTSERGRNILFSVKLKGKSGIRYPRSPNLVFAYRISLVHLFPCFFNYRTGCLKYILVSCFMIGSVQKWDVVFVELSVFHVVEWMLTEWYDVGPMLDDTVCDAGPIIIQHWAN